MKVFSTAAIVFGAIWNTKAHSWVECTNYMTEINGQDYQSSQCSGYPRSWADYGSSEFGQDRGANYQPGGEGASVWCPKTIGSPNDYTTTYSDSYPMAEYVAGSTVRVVWPAKNHANYECFGNIPDFAMKIMVNTQVNPSSDPTSLSGWDTLYDWHEEMGHTGTTGIDGIPFTNCPSFCENTDRAVCYGDMVVDESKFSSSGVYTFMWYWAFNGDDDIYTMCWEAYVDVNGDPTNIESGETDTNTNTEDDSSEDSETEYLVTIPICYQGANYDESVLTSSATSLFANLEWDVVNVEEGTNEFNATLQTHTTDSPASITEAASYDDHQFCDQIMIEFGNDGTHSCESCSDVVVYTEGSSSNSGGGGSSGDSGDNAIVAVILVFVIVILIIAAGIGYRKIQDGKKAPNSGIAGQTNTRQAITPAK